MTRVILDFCTLEEGQLFQIQDLSCPDGECEGCAAPVAARHQGAGVTGGPGAQGGHPGAEEDIFKTTK